MSSLDKIKTFLRETRVEMKRVSWLSKKQTINYTLVVLAISFSLALYLGLFDYIFVSLLMKFKFG